MTYRQAFLCGFLYLLTEANVPYATVWTLQKPLVCCWIVGLLFGCPARCIVCGGLVSMTFIGYRSVGSSMPEDISLAGICAATACAGKATQGIYMLAAVPGAVAGVYVWKLRLHCNRLFSARTEQMIRDGKKWSILLPAVLYPYLFSALVCIPTGAVFTLGAWRITSLAVSSGALPAFLMQALEAVGNSLPALGLLLSLLHLQGAERWTASLIGIAAGLGLPGVPLALKAAAGLAITLLFFLLRMDARVDSHGERALDPADPDLEQGETAGEVQEAPAGYHEKDAPALPPFGALAAAQTIWLLFVQAAYNTERMMGQAVAAAFLPAVSWICPDDPEGQREILLRQCRYLNTQPEIGSCLLGQMIRMEADRGEDPEMKEIRISVTRTSLMGSFGAIGDEMIQCGGIPILLLIFTDAAIRSGGKALYVWLYLGSALVLTGCFAAGSFLSGVRRDGWELLDLMEGRLLQRIRRAVGVMLPFLTGGMLAVYGGRLLAMYGVLPFAG